jgi:hypothetical protein
MGLSASDPVVLVPEGADRKDLELIMVIGDEISAASGTTLDGCFLEAPLVGRPPGNVLVALIAAVNDAPKS